MRKNKGTHSEDSFWHSGHAACQAVRGLVLDTFLSVLAPRISPRYESATSPFQFLRCYLGLNPAIDKTLSASNFSFLSGYIPSSCPFIFFADDGQTCIGSRTTNAGGRMLSNIRLHLHRWEGTIWNLGQSFGHTLTSAGRGLK